VEQRQHLGGYQKLLERRIRSSRALNGWSNWVLQILQKPQISRKLVVGKILR
jgi:hypothetical protein